MAAVTAGESRAQQRDVYAPRRSIGMAHYSALSPDRKQVLIVEMEAGWIPQAGSVRRQFSGAPWALFLVVYRGRGRPMAVDVFHRRGRRARTSGGSWSAWKSPTTNLRPHRGVRHRDGAGRAVAVYFRRQLSTDHTDPCRGRRPASVGRGLGGVVSVHGRRDQALFCDHAARAGQFTSRPPVRRHVVGCRCRHRPQRACVARCGNGPWNVRGPRRAIRCLPRSRPLTPL